MSPKRKHQYTHCPPRPNPCNRRQPKQRLSPRMQQTRKIAFRGKTNPLPSIMSKALFHCFTNGELLNTVQSFMLWDALQSYTFISETNCCLLHTNSQNSVLPSMMPVKWNVSLRTR